MNPPKFERLKKLREEFEQITIQNYEDWAKVDSWFRKAKPTLQNEWSEYLHEFKNLIDKSRFWTYSYTHLFKPVTLDDYREKDKKLIEAAERDAGEVQKAKQEILELFDGLLRLEKVESESAKVPAYQDQIEEKLEDKGNSSENPTDIWNTIKTFPLWLKITLITVIFIIVPILVALITAGLPILFRQEANSSNSNVVNSSSNLLTQISNQETVEPEISSPISESSPKDTLKPKTLSDGRVLIDVTPEYLAGFFKEHTDVQARKLIQAYIGKWIIISGKVVEVANVDSRSSFIILDTEKSKDSIGLTLFFTHPKEIDRIQTLRRGDSIKVLGQISSSNVVAIYLRNCEIVA